MTYPNRGIISHSGYYIPIDGYTRPVKVMLVCLHKPIYNTFVIGVSRYASTRMIMLTHAYNVHKMPSKMRAAQFEAGGPEKLTIGQVPIPSVKEKEVLIRVYATAINRADTLQRSGYYPPPPGASDILGLEAVGTIDSLGPGCSGNWKKGDKVMVLLPGGGNAEYVTSREELLMPVPKGMKLTEAAAIPEVWLTAFQLLHTIAKVQAGEYVLIHAGGSGVGTAATQLCKLANAKAIVTAGTTEKINFAKSLGAVVGFNYKEGEFSSKVLEATNGSGVNVILDCVGGSHYTQNMNCIATEGRWVVYGLMGGGEISGDLLRKMLMKRITMTGSTLRSRSLEYKESLVKDFMNIALPHFESGKLKPIIDVVLPFEQLRQAHELMESNKTTGKIVLQVNSEDAHEEL